MSIGRLLLIGDAVGCVACFGFAAAGYWFTLAPGILALGAAFLLAYSGAWDE